MSDGKYTDSYVRGLQQRICDLNERIRELEAKERPPVGVQLVLAGEKIRELEKAVGRFRDCLQLLVDNQNGCPLEKYREQWSEAMAEAGVLLGHTTSEVEDP